jgi:hypothetical protein
MQAIKEAMAAAASQTKGEFVGSSFQYKKWQKVDP